MNAIARSIIEQARLLPKEERLAVASEILALAEEDGAPDADVEAEWASEIEQRAKQASSGETKPVPWAEVESNVRRLLQKR